MTPERLRLEEARRWLAQAAKDLNAARLLAKPEPSRSVFHSQQAAEKAAKGFLAFHNVPFRKTQSGGARRAMRRARSIPRRHCGGIETLDGLRRGLPLFGGAS